MPDAIRALVWQGPDRVAVVERPRPAGRDGWALVDVAYAGICGTDLHIAEGSHPRAAPPLTLGHEIVGRLHVAMAGLPGGQPVAVNPLLTCHSCTPCTTGRAHVCEELRLLGIDAPGGAADQVAVPVAGLLALPDSAGPRAFSFVEPLAVAVHAIRRSRLAVGDRVLVVGAGPIGQALVRCALIGGAAAVYVTEPAGMRRALAVEGGATALDAHTDTDELHARTDGEGADVVFDAAGHPDVTPRLASWSATGGRIVMVGVHSVPAALDLQDIAFRELEVIGCRVYTRRDFERAVALIGSGTFDPAPIITSVLPLDRAPEALRRLHSGEEAKVLLEAGLV